jgi:hypothetical protein
MTDAARIEELEKALLALDNRLASEGYKKDGYTRKIISRAMDKSA